MNKNILFFLAIGIVIVGIVGWIIRSKTGKNIQSKNTATEKLIVSTSVYPLFYFASQIAGDKAEIKNITPSGAEPHDYEPTSQDIIGIEKSQMLILNGGVEPWGDKMRENLKGTSVIIVTAGDGLLTQQIDADGKQQTDPHVWLDPIDAQKEVHKITEGFMTIDPSNSSFYQQNEIILDDTLNQLDTLYKTGLADCRLHDIITSHAAFGYLATRYNLRQVSITGLSPDEEPSAQQLVKVATFAKDNNVKFIFFESLLSPKLSETIADEVGAKTLVLDPLEGLSDDDRKAGKDYYSIMKDNLKNLQIALQCKV